mmetsp:Transcript_25420/g.48010  ORF Transcript_25420/g.48010 Transcript_25420/m.48010 type:complete len:231 (-) Transcript_25420:1103-1795(-)
MRTQTSRRCPIGCRPPTTAGPPPRRETDAPREIERCSPAATPAAPPARAMALPGAGQGSARGEGGARPPRPRSHWHLLRGHLLHSHHRCLETQSHCRGRFQGRSLHRGSPLAPTGGASLSQRPIGASLNRAWVLMWTPTLAPQQGCSPRRGSRPPRSFVPGDLGTPAAPPPTLPPTAPPPRPARPKRTRRAESPSPLRPEGAARRAGPGGRRSGARTGRWGPASVVVGTA